jgi:hypothetical protein
MECMVKPHSASITRTVGTVLSFLKIYKKPHCEIFHLNDGSFNILFYPLILPSFDKLLCVQEFNFYFSERCLKKYPGNSLVKQNNCIDLL